MSAPLYIDQQFEQLRRENEELKRQLAAISTALDREFNPAKGDERSGDLLDDMACFVEHHQKTERTNLELEARVAKLTGVIGECILFLDSLKDAIPRNGGINDSISKSVTLLNEILSEPSPASTFQQLLGNVSSKVQTQINGIKNLCEYRYNQDQLHLKLIMDHCEEAQQALEKLKGLTGQRKGKE